MDETCFYERCRGKETHQWIVDKTYFKGHTRYQDVAIYEIAKYGKLLILDGDIQSVQVDEYIYHESIVHPALTAHSAPRSVLVIGGGEGATIREVLKHPNLEQVVMVDIDEELIGQCQKYLPEWHQGAFDDPRTTLLFADGHKYLTQAKERFDVIIIDICDRIENSPVCKLYSEKFYQAVRQHLEPGGIMVTQASALSSLDITGHAYVRNIIQKVFRYTHSYAAYIPSFWTSWGYVIATDTIDLTSLSALEIDNILKKRGLDKLLRYYDGQTHTHMFNLSKDIRTYLTR